MDVLNIYDGFITLTLLVFSSLQGFLTLFLLCFCYISFSPQTASAATFDVTTFGAKGDGNTDDTKVIKDLILLAKKGPTHNML